MHSELPGVGAGGEQQAASGGDSKVRVFEWFCSSAP